MSYKIGVKYCLGILVPLVMAVGIYVLIWRVQSDQSTIGVFFDSGEVYIELPEDDIIRASEIGGIKYAFLPGYGNYTRIKNVHGQQAMLNDSEAEIQFHTPQTITISRDEEVLFEGDIIFLCSENIYTTFIDLGGADISNLDKDNYMKAEIKVVRPDGETDLENNNTYIKCRGQSTYGMPKKPYTIKLDRACPVAGMNSSRKFYLLANAFDGSRALNRLVFDMLDRIGMEYTPDAVWTDLYVNGEYRGNYMICESIDVSANKINTFDLEKFNEMVEPVSDENYFETESEKGYIYDKKFEDVTGGYIIERSLEEYYAESECGFITDEGNPFIIKNPDNASREEIEYIRSVTQNIEELIASGNNEVFNYIDVDSFAKRYLIEELVLNSDAGICSYYFYKKKDDPLLYAGPGWDYDGSFGEMKEGSRNYNESILNLDILRCTDTLEWDEKLMENPYYRSILKDEYSEIRPVLIDAYEKQIDWYADLIGKSVQMDIARWPDLLNETMYNDYANTIRYLKFFLYHRLLYMDGLFGMDSSDISKPVNNGEMHSVKVWNGDTFEVFTISDGKTIDIDSLTEPTSGMCWVYRSKGEKVSAYVPVYEDMEIEQEVPVDE